jgi:hypothetical protein
MYLRRARVVGRSFAVGASPLTHVSTVVPTPAPTAKKLGLGLRRPCLVRALSRKYKKKLAGFTEKQSKHYRLYLQSGMVTLAAMYLRRVRVVGRSFAAGASPLTHASTVAPPPAPAAQNLGVGPLGPCGRQAFGGMLGAMAHCPCMARHSAERPNDHTFAGSARFFYILL